MHLRKLLIIGVVASCTAPSPIHAQTPRTSEGMSQAPQTPHGNVSTGGEYAPVHDTENRAITAGGFVDSGPVVFQDDTKKSGLSSWTNTMGTPSKSFIIETDGNGVGSD